MKWFYCYHVSQKVCSIVAYNLKFYIDFSCYFDITLIAVNFKSEQIKFATEGPVKILLTSLNVLGGSDNSELLESQNVT